MPPDLVTALMTPPSAPPYSAGMPTVLTCTSCRYSNTVFWRDWPPSKLLVETPSTVNWFSEPLAPLTWNPPSMSPGVHRRRRHRHRLEAAALRHPVEFFGGHVVRDERAARIDERRGFSRDLHGFRQLADPHLGVKLERAAKQHVDIGSLDLGEAGQLEPNVVAAGNQIRRLRTDRWRRSQTT